MLIYSFYTEKYNIFKYYWLNTYNGKGTIKIDNIERTHDESTHHKALSFWNAIKNESYDFYVWSDIDLIFTKNFCFSELCRNESIGLIYRDGTHGSPLLKKDFNANSFQYNHRRINASIITVPHKYKYFIEKWAMVSESADNLTKSPPNYLDTYFRDQLAISAIENNFPTHNIDFRYYLALNVESANDFGCFEHYNDDIKIYSPLGINFHNKLERLAKILQHLKLE